ncbi:hypothetical protein [Dactylosporangium darangshiense]|uniref:Uncharacterized protein n=1 Tax=Dactylosporangium darangshiense TaxID=579108 RepID=A0ABP8D8U9_9ACTN
MPAADQRRSQRQHRTDVPDFAPLVAAVMAKPGGRIVEAPMDAY